MIGVIFVDNLDVGDLVDFNIVDSNLRSVMSTLRDVNRFLSVYVLIWCRYFDFDLSMIYVVDDPIFV